MPSARELHILSPGEAHRRYTAFVNARARTTGRLFQGRFGCVAMDEAHRLAAVRRLAFNPAPAGRASAPKTGLGATSRRA
jgi:hypothetical protein